MTQNSKSQKPMVQNISCILPESQTLGGLFLGNIYGAQNAAILKQYGIRAVITASAETKIIYSTQDIPFHLKIDAHDKQQYYIVEHVNDCIHFIEQNRKLTNVYIHCYAGVSRSSAIVAAYLMWKYRWPLAKTLAFLAYKRIVAKPNDGFYNQLRQVEQKLNISSSYSAAQQNKVQKDLIELSPNYSSGTEVLIKRPTSTKAPLVQHKIEAYPFQSENSNYSAFNQKTDVPLQMENLGFSRSFGPTVIPKHEQKQIYTNHNHIPLPKVLSKRQSQSNPYTNSDYYDQVPMERQKRQLYNNYISPDVLPASPRQSVPQKTSLNKMNNSNRGQYNNSREESSIYTTNYSTSSNAQNVNKKNFQSQEKTKSGSRCIIRPKDLPGYKNY